MVEWDDTGELRVQSDGPGAGPTLSPTVVRELGDIAFPLLAIIRNGDRHTALKREILANIDDRLNIIQCRSRQHKPLGTKINFVHLKRFTDAERPTGRSRCRGRLLAVPNSSGW